MLTNILTDALPSQAIVYDTLLISVFGGMINGFAISMCLMVNATTGGTDFISIFLSEKTGMDSFNVILGFNAMLLVVAGLLFGWEKALYSIIFSVCFHTGFAHIVQTISPAYSFGGDKSCKADL